MPSEVGITLVILQALYDQSIAWPKLHPTTMTLLHDFPVSLRIGGKGDVFLLHGGVYHAFLRLLDLACMQGYREGKQLCYPFFSQAVSNSVRNRCPLKRGNYTRVRYLIFPWQSTATQQGEEIMDLCCYPAITEVIPGLESWHLQES
jgi:hypothetical protein